jgi:AraC family transcriptional regulator
MQPEKILPVAEMELVSYGSLSPILVKRVETRSLACGLPGAKLKRVLAYIDTHLGSELRVAEMASLANTSPHHFCELFRRSVGTSPHKYVVSRRIAHAKRLLHEDHLDMLDVALASGFANQSHFTKVFHRRTGMTPREFRASV